MLPVTWSGVWPSQAWQHPPAGQPKPVWGASVKDRLLPGNSKGAPGQVAGRGTDVHTLEDGPEPFQRPTPWALAPPQPQCF